MSAAEQALHDRVAQHIAATRFPFPDQTDWPEGYQTIVNAGNPRAAVRYNGRTHAPDILVVNEREIPREIGEVELELRSEFVPRLTISAMAAPLIPESGVRHFFLYVPRHLETRALEFIENYRLSVAGLRTFEVDADDVIHIHPVETKGHAKDHRAT